MLAAPTIGRILGQRRSNMPKHHLAIGLALLAGCTHGGATITHISGIAPLSGDVVAAVDTRLFETASFLADDGVVIPYRLLRPAQLRAGERYPLVIQLHGSGGIGTDNNSQLDRLARSWAMPQIRQQYPAYVLVPQFPIRSANYGPATPDQSAQASPVLAAALKLARSIAADNPVDHRRIYALGFSMGGSATWLAPTLQPELLAAIVPISGIAPANTQADAFRNLPVLAIHGSADEENPITSDRRFVAAVHATGGRQIQLREYAGLAHSPPADIYPGNEWRDWLFQQHR